MSGEITRGLPNEQSFEAQVLSRLDRISDILQSLDSRVSSLEARVEKVETRLDDIDARLRKLEARAYDTKPIWEQALKEIVDTRRELTDTRRELSKPLDRLDRLETRQPS